MTRIDGRWQGRLIDAAGFEGTLSAVLKGGRGKVSGTYSVSLVSHHASPPRSGSIAGELTKNRVELVLVPESDMDPKVHLKGDVFDAVGGVAIKGIYSVVPRKYSPLVGGVVVLSNDDTRSAEEITVPTQDVAEPVVERKRHAVRKRKK